MGSPDLKFVYQAALTKAGKKVTEHLSDLDAYKSAGSDGVHSRIQKELAEVISEAYIVIK